MLCEAQFLAQFFKPKKVAKNGEKVVFVGAIPHRHLFGLTFKVFLPLVCGGVVLREQILSHHLLVEVLNAHKNAILLASPTALEIMLKDEINNICNQPKMIFCAGSKLERDIRAGLQGRFGKHLKRFVEIYGSSETGVIGYCDKNSNENVVNNHSEPNSVFCAFAPVKLGLDSNSRLIISSAWLDSFEGERAEFISQDCAKIHSKNGLNSQTTFALLGRHDRIIKLNEMRISLDFVESILKSHSFIENARVGKLDGQNRLSAIITLSNEGKKHFRAQGKKGINVALFNALDSASLDAQSSSLKSAVRYIHIRSKLPYNEQGKIALKDFEECIKAKITPDFKYVDSMDSCISDSNNADSCILEAYIDEGCFYFSGHFAEFPLVPGFVELGFALEGAKKYLGIDTKSISQIQSVKFSSFLRPCDMCKIELAKVVNRLHFTIYANNNICASGKVALKEK